MAFNVQFDSDDISLVIALDKDGIPSFVVQREADGKQCVEKVDQELIDRPIPRDTFFDGPLENIELVKIEPLTVFVIRRPGVSANGAKQTCVYVRGQKYPRP